MLSRVYFIIDVLVYRFTGLSMNYEDDVSKGSTELAVSTSSVSRRLYESTFNVELLTLTGA